MSDMEASARTEILEFEQVAFSESRPAEDAPDPESRLSSNDFARLQRVERNLQDIMRDVGTMRSTGELTRLTQQRQEGALQQISASLQMLIGKVDALATEMAKDRARTALERDGHRPV